VNELNKEGAPSRGASEYITNARVHDHAQPANCATLAEVRELRQLGVDLLQLADKVEAFTLDPFDDTPELCA